MPKFNVSVPNPLGQQGAIEKLQGFSERLQSQYADQVSDLEHQWEENRLSFGFRSFGFRIEGAMTVEEDRVDVEGNLPLAAAMAKGKITSAIQEQLQKLLGS